MWLRCWDVVIALHVVFPSLSPTLITSCLFLDYVLHKQFNSSAKLTKSQLFYLPPIDILIEVVIFIFISYLWAIYEKPPRCGEQLLLLILLLSLLFIVILLLTGSKHAYDLKTRECEPCKNLPLPSNHLAHLTCSTDPLLLVEVRP